MNFFHQGLFSRMYKESLYLIVKRQPYIFKWAKNLNRHFQKKDMKMANKYMGKCSTSLITREIQIKTMMKCHYKHTRVAKIKKTNSSWSECWMTVNQQPLVNCWQGCRRTWLSYICTTVRNAKPYFTEL